MDFVSGVRLPLNDPAVWNSAVMGGICFRSGSMEISHDGLPAMAERKH